MLIFGFKNERFIEVMRYFIRFLVENDKFGY